MHKAKAFFFVSAGLLLLTLVASVAAAGGVSMSWGDYCSQSDGGPWNLTWACRSDTFTGIRMSCSFKPDQSHADFIGLSVFLAGMSEAPTVPDWWQLGPGGCREGALTLSTDGSTMTGGPEACIDPWGGAATGTLDYWGVTESILYVTATCNLDQPVAIEAGLKYFACQFRVDAHKTVSGECWGCLAPGIFGIRAIELRFAGGAEPEVLDMPFAGDSRCLSYMNTSGYDHMCGWPWGYVVPVRNSTWGQVKSLYR